MQPILSVVIPTYSPDLVRLERVLKGLKQQALEQDYWELVIVDNASPNPEHLASLDLSWHTSARVIREERLGLTWARTAGIQASYGRYLVFVDDDNLLQPDYLKNVVTLFQQHPSLGAIGGKVLPEFEVEPEAWVYAFFGQLAIRDWGEEALLYSPSERQQVLMEYPKFSPVGAGMALQRTAAEAYVYVLSTRSTKLVLDRTGQSLNSGGDCDLVLTLLRAGWVIGYFPQLQLIHLIPAKRLSKQYLAELCHSISRSWPQVLDIHGIRPWKKIPAWTILPRKIKTFFTYQAWSNPSAYIRWRAACGAFEGLAKLDEQ